MDNKIYKASYSTATTIILHSDYFIEIFKNSPDLSLTKVLIDGKVEIKIGDELAVTLQNDKDRPYETYYIANKMYPDGKRIMINEFEENNTTLFVLPLLGISAKLLLLSSNFINGYIATENHYNEIGDCVYIVYRYMPFLQYTNLLTILKTQKNYVCVEKSIDGRFDVVRFDIPKAFKPVVQKIIEGKYSKIPEYAKNIIVRFKNRKRDDIIYQTIFNSEGLREKLADTLEVRMVDLPKELREKPKLKLETWNL